MILPILVVDKEIAFYGKTHSVLIAISKHFVWRFSEF
jgi:hypothetical protein